MRKKLNNLISIYGKAQVAVWLHLNDTRTLDSWVHRGVPRRQEARVRRLLTNKGE